MELWEKIWGALTYPNIVVFMEAFGTPFVVALVGLLINGSLQRQNDLAQRQSSFREAWAAKFLNNAKSFDEEMTRFVFQYKKIVAIQQNPNLKRGDEIAGLERAVIDIALQAEMSLWEIEKYAAFAPVFGGKLTKSGNEFFEIAGSWGKNQGGDPEPYKTKQLQFNRLVGRVHAEILALDDALPCAPLPPDLAVESGR
jgi:hypothetical protein